MQTIDRECDPGNGCAQVATPCLAKLRLTSDDLAALCRQGFVTAERRGERTYFKLRFRRNRRQFVRYIGCDSVQAEAVQRELDLLQKERQEELKLARLTDATKQMLRDSKSALVSLLVEEGFAFHGYEIRRHRHGRTTSETSAPRGAGNLTNQSQETREDVNDEHRDQPDGRNRGDREGAS